MLGKKGPENTAGTGRGRSKRAEELGIKILSWLPIAEKQPNISWAETS